MRRKTLTVTIAAATAAAIAAGAPGASAQTEIGAMTALPTSLDLARSFKINFVDEANAREDAGYEVKFLGGPEIQPPRKAAVALKRGAPILGYDLAAAKSRIEALPWIRSATVERMLPDTVLISVHEREPLALWQDHGKFALVDASGKVILRDGLEKFSGLLMVIGDGAPKHAADLVAMLGLEPELMGRVKAATWVGGRRWDLHLDDGIDVRLPEKDPTSAWLKLAEYERNHGVLGSNVQVLDLRLPDRLIVQEAPEGGSSKTNQAADAPKGRQT